MAAGPPAPAPRRLAFAVAAVACAAGLPRPITTRSSGSRRRSRIYGGLPTSERGSPLAARWSACCSTARSACCGVAPVFLVALAALPDAGAAPALAARAGRAGDPRARARLADVVGRPVRRPRGSWSRWCPSRRRSRPSRRDALGPRALALGARRRRPRRRRVRRRAPGRPAAAQPRRPAHPAVDGALSGDADVGRYLPSLVTARPRRGPRGDGLGRGARRPARPRCAGPPVAPRGPAVHRDGACPSCCCWPRAPASTTGRAVGETGSVVSSDRSARRRS